MKMDLGKPRAEHYWTCPILFVAHHGIVLDAYRATRVYVAVLIFHCLTVSDGTGHC